MVPAKYQQSNQQSRLALGLTGDVNALIVAIILYMITMPVAEVRARFSEMVDEASSTHQRVEVTKNGRRAAVLLSADDYDGITETLDILADSDLVHQIAEASQQLAHGEWYDESDVCQAMREAGRG